MNNSNIRLMLANKDSLFRSGICSLLNSNPEIYVIAEASTGIETVEKYFKTLPDIIVADITLPLMSGLDAIRKIRETDNSAKALFLTSYFNDEYIYLSIKAGGWGLLHRNIAIGEMIYAIKEIISGRRYFGKIYCEKKYNEVLKRFANNKNTDIFFNTEKLSERESEILLYISEGFTSTEIARQMNLSKRTVDTYRSAIMQKFELKSLPELIKFAIKYSLEKYSPPEKFNNTTKI